MYRRERSIRRGLLRMDAGTWRICGWAVLIRSRFLRQEWQLFRRRMFLLGWVSRGRWILSCGHRHRNWQVSRFGRRRGADGLTGMVQEVVLAGKPSYVPLRYHGVLRISRRWCPRRVRIIVLAGLISG